MNQSVESAKKPLFNFDKVRKPIGRKAEVIKAPPVKSTVKPKTVTSITPPKERPKAPVEKKNPNTLKSWKGGNKKEFYEIELVREGKGHAINTYVSNDINPAARSKSSSYMPKLTDAKAVKKYDDFVKLVTTAKGLTIKKSIVKVKASENIPEAWILSDGSIMEVTTTHKTMFEAYIRKHKTLKTRLEETYGYSLSNQDVYTFATKNLGWIRLAGTSPDNFNVMISPDSVAPKALSGLKSYLKRYNIDPRGSVFFSMTIKNIEKSQKVKDIAEMLSIIKNNINKNVIEAAFVTKLQLYESALRKYETDTLNETDPVALAKLNVEIENTKQKIAEQEANQMDVEAKLAVFAKKAPVKKKRTSQQIMKHLANGGKKLLKMEERLKLKKAALDKELEKLKAIKIKHKARMIDHKQKMKDRAVKKAGAINPPKKFPKDDLAKAVVKKDKKK